MRRQRPTNAHLKNCDNVLSDIKSINLLYKSADLEVVLMLLNQYDGV